MVLPLSMESVCLARAHAKLVEEKSLDARPAYKINQLSTYLVVPATRSAQKEPLLMSSRKDVLDALLGALSAILKIKKFAMTAK